MIFLNRDILYRVLQREAPENVYLDGSATAGISTASTYSEAEVLGTVYSNLNRIYENIWPQTAVETLDAWEATAFRRAQLSLATTEERQTRLVQKFRRQRGLSFWDIITIVSSFVPEGVWVEIRERGCNYARWRIGRSPLGIETYLSPDFVETWNTSSVCTIDENNLDQLKTFEVAYSYYVYIFEYQLSPELTTQLELELTDSEPARSQHQTFQNVPISFMNWTEEINNVDLNSGVRIITRDSTQTTGYRGRRNG